MTKMSIGLIALLALQLAFATGSVQAQHNERPVNFINGQLSEQQLNQTIALSDAKLVKAQAELLRKHYEALVKSGFSKDESLKIVIAMASRDKS